MSKSLIEWYTDINLHYGALERFEDAPTVRIQLRQATEWIQADNRQVRLLKDHPDVLEDWKDSTKDERLMIIEIRKELQAWLDRRYLDPDPITPEAVKAIKSLSSIAENIVPRTSRIADALTAGKRVLDAA